MGGSPIRLPETAEVLFLATAAPDTTDATALRATLGSRLVCLAGEADYAAHRDRIWGVVNWAPSNFAALVSAHGAPPHLAWLHQSGVGMESVAGLPLPLGVAATSIKGSAYYATPMAEHAVARMLEWAKGLRRLAEAQAERSWEQFDPPTLAGKTAMIFGHGTIGQAIVRRLTGFDMRLVVVRRHGVAPLPEGAEAINLEAARDRLGEADHIVLTLPLTAETQGFLGATEIDRLKRDVFIVNLGRAGVVDEAALAAALSEGRIGGVALDVFWREPLSPDDPVWVWPRTAITPHMSANMAGGNTALIAATAIETLDIILAGKMPANRADLDAGY